MTETAQAIRSPSYPSMSLADAIDAVRKIEHSYRTSRVDRVAAAKLVGYSSLSGPANKALAALAQYGLVERAGKGEMRVAARALAILHPDSPEEKAENIRLAAFDPPLFSELHERYPDMLPPEDGIVTYLNRKGFNPNAIRPAVKAYLQTLLFLKEAGADESHGAEQSKSAASGIPEGDEQAVTYGGARVGDTINYESGGVITNSYPLRVRAVSDDGGWVFVDGAEAGLEMGQVVVLERMAEAEVKERPTLPLGNKLSEDAPLKAGTRKAVFPLDEGDVALIFPEGISPGGLEELGQYLDIFLKKEIKKSGANTA